MQLCNENSPMQASVDKKVAEATKPAAEERSVRAEAHAALAEEVAELR